MTSGQFIFWGALALVAWGLYSAYRLRSSADQSTESTPEQRQKQAALAVAAEAKPAVKVKVVDIDMPFGSMVMFMVKLALASIPAFIILAILYAGLTSIISLL